MTWETDEADGWGGRRGDESVSVGAATDDWGASPASGWAQKSQVAASPLDSNANVVDRDEPKVAKDSQWSTPENVESEAGWLNSGEPDATWNSSEDLEDAWLDDEPSPDLEPPSDSDAASSKNLGGFSALFLVLLGLGVGMLWFWFHPLNQSSQRDVVKKQAEAQASLEALDLGRRTVVSAKESLKRKDFEMAAAQLKSAVTQLSEGNAPVAEVQGAKRMLAHSLFEDGKLVEARSVWKELGGENASWRKEAQKNMDKAERELRKLANSNLMEAEAALRVRRYREAGDLAQAALQSYQRYGGDNAHLGMANGTLGYAEWKRGLREPALRHLTAAHNYYPEGGYQAAIRSLAGPNTVEVTPEISSQAEPSQPRGLDDLGPNYPQSGSPGGHHRSRTEPSLPVGPPKAKVPTPRNPYRPPPPKPKPKPKSNVLPTYEDHSK